MLYILGQIFGILGWIFFLISYHAKRENKVIFLQIMSSIFYTINYLLIGATTGFYISLFELIKSIGYYKSDKDKYIFLYSLPIYLVILYFSEINIFVIIAILASILDGYVCLRDTKTMVYGGIVSNFMWVIYDLFVLDFAGAFTDFFLVISNLTIVIKGVAKYIGRENVYTVRNSYISKSTIDFVYHLDQTNLDEEYRWSKEKIAEITKGDKHNYIFIKDKNKIVGYVNFISLKEEVYNKMINAKEIYDTFELEDLNPFKKGKKLYLNMNTIVIKNEYNNSDTIDKVVKSIKRYIDSNRKDRYFIHNICIFTVNELEETIVKKLGFTKVKNISNECFLYELVL